MTTTVPATAPGAATGAGPGAATDSTAATDTTAGTGAATATGTATRPDLVLALAGPIAGPPDPEVCRLLELPPPPGAAAHTDVFVLDTHPYASVHLGAEGMIGGDAGDRVAGFWRALGLVPPAEPDQLGTLLALYARLGAEEVGLPAGHRRRAVSSARAALLWEHLAPWAPVYLAAVAQVGDEFHRAWAALARDALAGEADGLAPRAQLPTALASAPPPLGLASRRELLDGLLAPVCSGMVVTRADLVHAGADLGLGVRRGERRFTLDALVDQDAAGILGWLGRRAAEWSRVHRAWHAGALEPVGEWWARRAAAAATTLQRAAAEASG